MEDFIDYYEILGAKQEATEKEIKKAYLDKCFIFHTDRLQGAPESAKKLAEQELIKINRAYEILSNNSKRKAYDSEWVTHKNKPKPELKPSKLHFKNMNPNEIRTATFILRNAGGPYNKVSIPNPDTWLKLAKWNSLSNTDELPLQVTVEVEAPEKGKSFSEIIKIKLDNEEALLPVILQIKPGYLALLSRGLKKQKVSTKEKTNKVKIPNWLKSLLLVASFSIISLGIGLFINTFIPLWLLLGFSAIYSIEKWFYYPTRKHKWVGKLYRLFLNLSVLSLLVFIIWSGVELFSKHFLFSPLVASLVFIFEIALLIWLYKVVSKNSWRWPSMKLTVFSLVCIFLIFSFSGVQPMTDLKDILFDKITTLFK
jgi:hypothetical protein